MDGLVRKGVELLPHGSHASQVPSVRKRAAGRGRSWRPLLTVGARVGKLVGGQATFHGIFGDSHTPGEGKVRW